MNLLNWFQKSPQSEIKKYHEITNLGGAYSPFDSLNGSALTSREQYTGWVYTAVTTIANNVAKLQFHLLNESDKQINHEYLKLVSYDLMESIVSYLKLKGTAYIWKNTIGGRVRSLHVLRPDLVTPKWDSTKTQIIKYEYFLNGKVVPFDAKEIIVVMNFNPANAYPYITRGMSDIEASALSIDTERAQSVTNWKAFENGANPGGVLSTSQDLQPEQVERMTTAWNNKFKGPNNAHKLAVLTQGATFSPTTMSSKDMEYIEGKKLTRDEILAVFKVPKAVLGIGEGASGNMNIRNFQELFARNAIEPLAIKIADSFNRQLFNGIGRFEFYNIIPQDENNIRSDYQSGILTLNEARSLRGMSPVKDGDKFIYDDITAVPTETTVVQDEVKMKMSIGMQRAIDTISETLIPGSEKAMILKVKKRDKRLTKYEEKIVKAVKDIAEQQENDILSQIKDEKGIKPVKIDFTKYKAVWMLKLNPIYKMLFQEEGDNALKEIGISSGFQIGAPEVAKRIKSNIYLMSKSVDSTTKEKLERVFEKSTNEGLGAFDTKELIKEQFTMMKESRAEAISRTETVRMSNEASITAWKDSGVVEKQKWWTSLDDRVSPICNSLHGKTIELGKNFFDKGDTLTTTEGSFSFDYSDVGGPPSHVNCRCTLIPVVK